MAPLSGHGLESWCGLFLPTPPALPALTEHLLYASLTGGGMWLQPGRLSGLEA